MTQLSLVFIVGTLLPTAVTSFQVPSQTLATNYRTPNNLLNNQQQQQQQSVVGPLYVSTPTASSSLFPSSSSSSPSSDESDATKLSSSSTSEVVTATTATTSTLSRKELVRNEGGRLAFDTKYGALNLFAIYYGFVAIALGLPWYLSLCVYQLFQKITNNRWDKNRAIPIFLNHLWGVTLMRLTRCFPQMENRHILQQFYQEKRCAMFVANHNSWMDIPFLGSTIGWRNYKLIAKQELGKVPILSKAIIVGGNLMVDRTDKKSGLKTLKKGIEYLKDGVHLCTFPEGTRTRTGRLQAFKNGAFKMAHKAGAPIIPISIVGADNVQPSHWMFPYRPAYNRCKVVVHEPIESTGKTEEELAQQVRAAMIEGLPENQRPLQ